MFKRSYLLLYPTVHERLIADIGKRSKPFTRRKNIEEWRENWYLFYSRRGRRSLQKLNLQRLYKIQNKFNFKSRKRKFKSKIKNNEIIKWSSRALTRPRQFRFMGLRFDHARRMTYRNLLGLERAIMPTKQKVWLRHTGFPDFFVTKKSSKSRMGKGKGKIYGRILKVRKGTVPIEINVASPFKTRKWVKAVRLALPSTTRLVYHSREAEITLRNYYRSKHWLKFRTKVKKKKFYQIQKKKLRKPYRIFVNKEFAEEKYRPWFYFKWRHMQLPGLAERKLRKKRISKLRLNEDYRQLLLFYNSKIRRARFFRPSVENKRFRKRRPFPITRHYRSAAFYCPGGGGGYIRNFFFHRVALKMYSKLFFAAMMAPDEDGYYGVHAHANILIKRKLAREKFTRRSGLQPSRTVF